MTRSLDIAFAGGMPPALGGGGLELQMARTADALRRLGHRVERVEAAPAGARFDILHAFHAEAWLAGVWPHWKRNRCPVVVSPVMTIGGGLERRAMRAARRLPLLRTSARLRAEMLEHSDAIVALTDHERRLLISELGANGERIQTIGNGVDAVAVEALPPPPSGTPQPPFALMVGNVTARKRQAEVLAATGTALPFVIAGGFEGGPEERASWRRLVERHGATWLGEVEEPLEIRALQRDATALVLYSAAEGESLAVLETLAVGTPAVLSDIPAHRELARRFPAAVRLVRSADGVRKALADIASSVPPAPQAVPTWDDVARRLEGVYRSALDRTSR